jgi:hypothetical protein
MGFEGEETVNQTPRGVGLIIFQFLPFLRERMRTCVSVTAASCGCCSSIFILRFLGIIVGNARPNGSSIGVKPLRDSAMFRACQFAYRQLRRSPGFAITATLILAIGIGVTTAMYTPARLGWEKRILC